MQKAEYFEVIHFGRDGKSPPTSTGIAFMDEGDAIDFADSADFAMYFGVRNLRGDEKNVRKVEVSVYKDYHDYNYGADGGMMCEYDSKKEEIEPI